MIAEKSLVPDDQGEPPTVVLEGASIIINRLALTEPDLARYLARIPAAERAIVARDALKVGLIALARATVNLDVDLVRAEFGSFLNEVTRVNQTAQKDIEQLLVGHLADGSGSLPRLLRAYLGEQGAMAGFVSNLADPNNRKSVISQLRELLGKQFVGEDAELMKVLDPNRESSPLFPLYRDLRVLHESMSRLEGARQAAAAEKVRGTAKGTEFEDLVEPVLGGICMAAGHALERTSRESGDTRKLDGDFVITMAGRGGRAAGSRVVLETRNKKFNAREIRRDLEDARRNRDALVAVAIYAPGHLPAGYGPITLHGTDVIIEFNPDEPEDARHLELALGVARTICTVLAEAGASAVDAGQVRGALGAIQSQVECFRSMQIKLTAIGTTAAEVKAGLKTVAASVLDSLAVIEGAIGEETDE